MRYTTIKTIYPVSYLSAYQGWNILACFLKNGLSWGCTSDYLIFSILLVLKGAIQVGYIVDVLKVTK